MFFFFFQAEDGIRDLTVTGVQTCALPILAVCPVVQQALRLMRLDEFFAMAPDPATAENLLTSREREILAGADLQDRKSTRLNSSHSQISYAVFCLKKKTKKTTAMTLQLQP